MCISNIHAIYIMSIVLTKKHCKKILNIQTEVSYRVQIALHIPYNEINKYIDMTFGEI